MGLRSPQANAGPLDQLLQSPTTQGASPSGEEDLLGQLGVLNDEGSLELMNAVQAAQIESLQVDPLDEAIRQGKIAGEQKKLESVFKNLRKLLNEGSL